MYNLFEKLFKRVLLFYLICANLSIILAITKLLGIFPYGWLFVILPFLLGITAVLFLLIYIYIKG